MSAYFFFSPPPFFLLVHETSTKAEVTVKDVKYDGKDNPCRTFFRPRTADGDGSSHCAEKALADLPMSSFFLSPLSFPSPP